MTDIETVPVITLTRDPLGRSGDKSKSPNVISMHSRYIRSRVRLGLGYIEPGRNGRKVFQGPLVPGPWAFTYPLAGVIDNSGTGTAVESGRNRAAGLEFDAQVGDVFEIDGRLYELREDFPSSHYPELYLIEGQD